MTSSFYVVGGAGATQFAGDKKFTVTVGGGYQVLPLDWMAVRVGFGGSHVSTRTCLAPTS